MRIEPKVARWATPLLKPCRYKGAKGGRSGGKSHQFCEMTAEKMASRPDFKVAGIREIQKSIKYSIKSLLEKKIHDIGASYLFDMQDQEIKRRNGAGVAVFLGMQDHTADSVKGLEDFDAALVDEANALSHGSLKKLTPTFRKEGSEILFAWNPDEPTDPVDEFFAENEGHEDFTLIHVNITDNPFASSTAIAEYKREKARAERLRRIDPNVWDQFLHVWHGHYDTRSEKYVFRNWRVGEVDVPENAVWFYGVDWGFSQDPTAGNRLCIIETEDEVPDILHITHEVSETAVATEALPGFLIDGLPGLVQWPSRADNARPETIDYVRRHGVPKMKPATKGKGSVEDGVTFLQSFDIVIHPRCAVTKREFQRYSYKTDRDGEILPVIEDANNHNIDGIRYAVERLHRKGKLIEKTEDQRKNPDPYDFEDEEESWKTV